MQPPAAQGIYVWAAPTIELSVTWTWTFFFKAWRALIDVAGRFAAVVFSDPSAWPSPSARVEQIVPWLQWEGRGSFIPYPKNKKQNEESN